MDPDRAIAIARSSRKEVTTRWVSMYSAGDWHYKVIIRGSGKKRYNYSPPWMLHQNSVIQNISRRSKTSGKPISWSLFSPTSSAAK